MFQGLSIPALNGVLSAWALKNEKSRMVTLTYCGNSSFKLQIFEITFTVNLYTNFIPSLRLKWLKNIHGVLNQNLRVKQFKYLKKRKKVNQPSSHVISNDLVHPGPSML